MVCNGQARLGYDWNRIIHLEPEPKFRFQLAGSGYGFPNYGSSMKEQELTFSNSGFGSKELEIENLKSTITTKHVACAAWAGLS